MNNTKKEPWFVYIAECKDQTLYTGIAKNVEKRILDHNAGKNCKYTKARRPVSLRYKERHIDKSSALKREIELKGFTRNEKLELIAKMQII